MAERSLRQPGLPVDYYAPDYKIEIDGYELDQATKGDVLNVSVKMDSDNPTGFTLTVNNWDDKKRKFKYSDSHTFEVGNRIHIKMGYAGKLLSMVRGVITSMAASFPESGSPTIGVSGVDALFRLKDKKPGPEDRKTFPNMKDWEIAREVAMRNNLKFKGTEEGEKRDLVVQKDQDELKFLKELASRIDFDCYIRFDPTKGEDALHFVRPTDGRSGGVTRVYELEWGKSLINFNPILTISDQVGNVTVRGWDPSTKQPISYTARPEDLAQTGNGMSGPKVVKERLGGKDDWVVNQPTTSFEEARKLAIALLRERAYKYLTGTGQVIGLPDLRPGDNILIHGLGERFSGPRSKPFSYYVKMAEHTLGSSGYMTRFDVRSVFDGRVT